MAIVKQLLKWYGCLPPWFPTSDATLKCPMDQANKAMNKSELIHVKEELYHFYTDMKPMQCMKQCQKPCNKIDIRVNKIWFKDYYPLNNEIVVSPDSEVLVHTEAYTYHMFNLIVDLGSSLGLWLGFSALSIFDELIQQSNNWLFPMLRKIIKVDKH